MNKVTAWMNTHKFETHAIIFGLMILSSVGLYWAAQAAQAGWLWGLLGVFVAANASALLVK
jgi:uncharacterized membrane protein